MNEQKPELCPDSNHPMKEKQKRDGTGSFWGCTGYPECRYIWKNPLIPPKSYTPRPAKTEQVRQMQETKAGFIAKAQDRKDDSIRLSSAGRDATLIITTFFPKLDSPEVIRKTWLQWREWLYNRAGEIPSPDKEPFKTMNAPTREEDDPNWPPEDFR